MKECQDHTPSIAPVKHDNVRAVAVAVQASLSETDSPGNIVATGRGRLAEEILEIAFTNDIKVREDGPLANILVALDLDTPIPSEAIVTVAEILAKVYEANKSSSLLQRESKGTGT